jgi:hypothetical protein
MRWWMKNTLRSWPGGSISCTRAQPQGIEVHLRARAVDTVLIFGAFGAVGSLGRPLHTREQIEKILGQISLERLCGLCLPLSCARAPPYQEKSPSRPYQGWAEGAGRSIPQYELFCNMNRDPDSNLSETESTGDARPDAASAPSTRALEARVSYPKGPLPAPGRRLRQFPQANLSGDRAKCGGTKGSFHPRTAAGH